MSPGEPNNRYGYLHGFASSPDSRKGVALAARWRELDLDFERPDLNRPTFAELSHTAMLAEIDALDQRAEPKGAPWCFIGSSLGGWVAARWAELHPRNVARLLLLCPGFDLARRWPAIVGEEGMERWRRRGQLAIPDSSGQPVGVHWGFIEEAALQPGRPEVSCPTLIVHGTRDDVVPVQSSREYAAERPHVELLEVDDDHSLAASISLIVAEAERFFGT